MYLVRVEPHASHREAATVLLQISANDDGVRANKPVGRKSDVRRKIHTAAHTSRNPGQRRRRCEPAERTPQAGAVVAARSCNSELEPGKAQSYLCLRPSVEPLRTRMPITPTPRRHISFP